MLDQMPESSLDTGYIEEQKSHAEDRQKHEDKKETQQIEKSKPQTAPKKK